MVAYNSQTALLQAAVNISSQGKPGSVNMALYLQMIDPDHTEAQCLTPVCASVSN